MGGDFGFRNRILNLLIRLNTIVPDSKSSWKSSFDDDALYIRLCFFKASRSTCMEEGLKDNEEGCIVRVAEVTPEVEVIELEPEPGKP